MQKYIVEAPVPKDGQKASSGGIREKGKLIAQFTNPLPYEEPSYAYSQTSFNLKEALIEEGKLIVYDLVKTLWYEYGKPLIKAKLHHLCTQTLSAHTTAYKSSRSCSYECLDNDISTMLLPELEQNNTNKIVTFPIKQAI